MIYVAAILLVCIIAVISTLASWSVYPAKDSELQEDLANRGCTCGWRWERCGRRYRRDDCPLHGTQARLRKAEAASRTLPAPGRQLEPTSVLINQDGEDLLVHIDEYDRQATDDS